MPSPYCGQRLAFLPNLPIASPKEPTIHVNPMLIQCNPTVIRTFKRRDFLPLSRTLLWQIETGVVRTLTCNEDGTVIPLGVWGPGDIVGQPLVHTNPCQIECLVDVHAHSLGFVQIKNLDQVMLSHIYRTQELLQMRTGQVSHRLWQLLQWLAHYFGKEMEQGRLIELRLTHQDMAEIIDTTRVTVTRLLRQFEQEGVISRLGTQGLLLHCSSSL
jgi:CRP-like cAMP-binding protein